MIRSRIQIENGPIHDFFTEFGFIYLSADNRTSPPEKKRDATSYAGEEGEHADSRAVADAFTYTARFLIEGANTDMANVNAKIAAFNAAIRGAEGGVKRCREVTFYNDYKRVKITGTAELVSEPTVFHRHNGRQMEYAVVELKIRVSDPGKCDFSTLSLYAEYDKRDLTEGWWGYNAANNTAYKASASYARSLVAPVRKGDRITVTTKGIGAAWPVFFIDDSRRVLGSISDPLELDGELLEPDWDCKLIVNCHISAYDEFSVIVDRCDAEAAIMTLDFLEP